MISTRENLPLVSIAIPTYQGETFLEETLSTAIAQTYPNIEIIISDDGSTDRTVEITRSFQKKSSFEVKIFNHHRLGMVENWNFCIKTAKGKYIKFLFQDDLLLPNCVEKMVELAEQDLDIGFVFSAREIFLSEDAKTDESCQLIYQYGKDLHLSWSNLKTIQNGQDLLTDSQILQNPINKIGEPTTVLVRREVFERIGGFDPELSQLVDLDMWMRIMVHYKIGFVNTVLSRFRIHINQQTRKTTNIRKSNLEHFKLLLKMLHAEAYCLLPQSLKHDIFSKKILELESDIRVQLERAKGRILQLEGHETELEIELKKTQDHCLSIHQQLENTETQLCEATATIEGMESSKFWKMREAWMKVKHLLITSKKRISEVNVALIFFKSKRLLKLFITGLSEDGFITTFKRVKYKIVKKLTGNVISQVEEEIRQDAKLEQPQPIKISTSDSPIVSIIIPVYNNFLYTFNCLNSLSKRVNPSVAFEVIIVDDASSDETQQSLKLLAGIRVLTSSINQGFIRSCNLGASKAKGQYLYFLNNDTQILPNCLESLLSIMENDGLVGAVGSQLIYANGKLQEAGGIIWQDAYGWNYGRLDSPEESQYNYVRSVDYCSGASLLVRTNLFRQLGGFSEEFLPAYYEDTDLCFAIRKLGYKVLYQPKSKIIHYEGITSGTSLTSGIKKYQEVNRTKFQQKWQTELQKHFTNDSKNVPQGARRLQSSSTILVIDSYVPLYDRESGCVRLLNILKLLLELDYSIIFFPDNGNPEEPYTSTLQQMGIEVLYGTPNQPDLQAQLIKRLPLVDVVWLCRPELCEKYLELIRYYSSAPIIYDTIDLHFLRLKRQQEYLDRSYQNTPWSWETYQKLETDFAKKSNATVVVTEAEKNTLQTLFVNNIWVIPNIHQVASVATIQPFEERSGLVFIGSYNHPPNIDAVVWLSQEIMPLIWQYNPDITVTLLGSNLKEEVKALENERVIVTGYVENVEPYFIKNRLFVAPLRFGAGMKGKIGHSMSYGLPTVTTSIGAEGMGLKDAYDVMVADEAESFAKRVIKLYNDSHLWNFISQNSLKTVARYSPEQIKNNLSRLLMSLTNNKIE